MTEWEYGVEHSEPINGDRVISLYPTLEEALECMAYEADCRPVLLGRRTKPHIPPWEPIPDDTPRGRNPQ